jgi:emp24/gp25L/p24 family/GOLD
VCSGNFDCWEETGTRLRGCRNIAAWIERYSGKGKDVWRSQEGASEEIFDVQLEGNQRYRLCFESAEGRSKEHREDDAVASHVVVGFNIRVKSAVERALPDTELGPETLRALELLEAASSAEQQWQNLLDHFDFLRNREAFHRNLAEQINNRVMGWSLLESFLVVTMAVAQVWYWKSFFEQRRYL